MQYDDHGLVGTTWINMAICVVAYVKYDNSYLYASNVEVWCIVGDHVRLWLCACMCGIIVECRIVPTLLYESIMVILIILY